MKKQSLIIIVITLVILTIGCFAFFLYLSKSGYKADEINISASLPKAPSQLTSAFDANNKIILYWSNSFENDSRSNIENGFKIERTTDTNKPFTELLKVDAVTNHYTDNQVTADNKYFYRVQAYDSDGSSIFSNISSPSQLVKKDLLALTGDFETSNYTIWQGATDSWSHYGTRESKPNDSVADGWKKITDYSVHYDANNQPLNDNTIYNIEPATGINGTNSQFFSVKKNTENSSWSAILQTRLNSRKDPEDPELPLPYSDFKAGDTLSFKVDKIFMSDYSLPAGATVKYYMKLYTRGQNPGDNLDRRIELTPKSLEEVNVDDNSVEIELTVPQISAYNSSNEYYAYAELGIEISGLVGDHQPGLHLDGAHIFVKKAGTQDYETHLVPAPHERNINTGMVFYNPTKDDVYELAKDYDAIMLQESTYINIPQFKYYNPNIKIYLYEITIGLSDYRDYRDYRDQKYQDPIFSNAPIGMSWALSNPVDSSEKYADKWFYKYKADQSVLNPPGDTRTSYKKYFNDGTTPLNYIFSNEYQTMYYTHIANDDYQRIWLENTLKKAEQYKPDGIFFDSLTDLKETGVDSGQTATLLEISPYEVQDFQRNIFPEIRKAGLETMQNLCGRNDSTYPGKIYLDPSWKKDDPNLPDQYKYKPDSGLPDYTDSNEEIVPDIFFQEWAFFSHWGDGDDLRNRYQTDYWLKGLQDMDNTVKFNNNLPLEKRKKVFMQILGVERSDDPSEGIDGWGNFSLASFLLGKSEYSTLGVEKTDGYRPINMNFSRSSDLGEPIENHNEHTDLYSDKTLQTRLFTGGLVVVNGHPSENRIYTLPKDLIDEDGKTWAANTEITLKPHTGRVLLFPKGSVSQINISSYPYSYSEMYKLSGDKQFKTDNIEIMIGNNNYLVNNVSDKTWQTTIKLPAVGEKAKVQIIANNNSKDIKGFEVVRRKAGDAVGDNLVCANDFSVLMNKWGKTTDNYIADFNNDNLVNVIDYSVMMRNWDGIKCS